MRSLQSSSIRGLVPSALAACAALSLVACGEPEIGADEEDASATSYAPIAERLGEVDLEKWIALKIELKRNFADVCGDTFCGGDYSNLTHVSLDCSATKAGTINSCTWVIAGSIEYVDGKTGAISVDQRTFACPIAVHTKTKKFFDSLLGGGEPLRQTIPGTGESFYEGLADCFANSTAKPPPAETGTKYRELVEWMNEHGDFLPWWQARRGLVREFDDACGDTFCEGDYSDISGLGLACAVEETNGHVKSCTWTFAGNYFTVTTKGKVSAHLEKWSCPIAIDASADDLVAALSGDGALHAPLPGKTTSLMDALVDCL